MTATYSSAAVEWRKVPYTVTCANGEIAHYNESVPHVNGERVVGINDDNDAPVWVPVSALYLHDTNRDAKVGMTVERYGYFGWGFTRRVWDNGQERWFQTRSPSQ